MADDRGAGHRDEQTFEPGPKDGASQNSRSGRSFSATVASSAETFSSPPPAVPQPANAEIVDAELVSSLGPGDWYQSLSLPHIGWALFWFFVILSSQLGFGVVWQVGRAVATSGASLSADETAPDGFGGDAPGLAMVYTTLTTLLTGLAIVIGLFRGEFRRRIGLRGLAPSHAILAILLVVPQAVLASEVTNCAAELFPQLTTEIFEEFGQQAWWLVFVGACLLPGVGEEILFRGFLGRGLVARHGLAAGMIITSALFGLIHVDPVQGCGAMFLGLGLHGIFLSSKSLVAPILVHTLNNALAFAAMKYGERVPIAGFTTPPDGSVSHIPWYLILAALSAVAALAWALFQGQAHWTLPNGTEWTAGYASGETPPKELDAMPIAARPTARAIMAVALTYAVLLASLYAAYQRSS